MRLTFADREAQVELTLDGLGRRERLVDPLADPLMDGTVKLPESGRVKSTPEPYGTRRLKAGADDRGAGPAWY